MRDVKMKVDDLSRVIAENKDTHVATFEKAYGVYEERVKREFAEVVAALRDHKVSEVDIGAPYRLTRPTNHIEDYDTALNMLADETRKHIVLSRQEYEQYILDDWGWKQQFTTSTQAYLGSDQ